MSDSPIYPHDPIEEIGLDVFLVRGSIKMNALRIVQTAALLVKMWSICGAQSKRADQRREVKAVAGEREARWRVIALVLGQVRA